MATINLTPTELVCIYRDIQTAEGVDSWRGAF
jgi:hypothetical protein